MIFCPPHYPQMDRSSSRCPNGCSVGSVEVTGGEPKKGPYLQIETGDRSMSATIINIIIQLIAGAVGGNAAGNGLKDYNLGTTGNTIAGALGGIGGGQILTALLPMLAGTAGNVDIGAIVGQAVGGGGAGAIVTIVVGLIKNTMSGQPAR